MPGNSFNQQKRVSEEDGHDGIPHEVLDLLVEAMSFAQRDELAALRLVKKASSLFCRSDKTNSRCGITLAGGLARWQTKRVSTFIDERISSTIYLDELAELVKLSTSYFSAAFKVSFGVPPHNYIVRQRIELAKQKLRYSDTPLSEIALDCGLSDHAHFSRLFRRVTGSTPSAWRKTVQISQHRSAN